MVDLLFAEGLGSTDLVFGETGTPPVILQLGMGGTLAAAAFEGVLKAGALPIGGATALPPVVGPLAITPVPVLSSSAITAAPIPDCPIGYDNAVNRAPFRWAQSMWQDAAARPATCRSPHRANRASQTAAVAQIRAGAGRRIRFASGWQPMLVGKRPALRVPWGSGTAREATARQPFEQLLSHLRPGLDLLFLDGLPLRLASQSGWRELFRRPRPTLVMRWALGAPCSAFLVAPSQIAAPSSRYVRLPWDEARLPGHGLSLRPVDPPVGPGYEPSTHLLFDDSMPASLHLVFGRAHFARPHAKVVIPTLRAYIVVNDVTLLRTSNSLALPAFSLSLSIDADSWCWGWQASLPSGSLDDVLPSAPGAPVELEGTVNGVNFLLLAEKVTRDRRFAQSRITVSGRGIAAELGDPYAPVVSRNNATDQTAQQLMADALTVNGVGIGWGLDWHLTDWLVPAGAWSHTGSHIEAVTRIAEAAGAYVQASRNSQTLAILHRYPVAPWDWPGIDPDFSLPAAATTRESVEWLEKPLYNAVFVSGEGSGILGHVQRAGTAGDWSAQMITDALTTHADAARQRGLAILADTGRQQLLTLDTPVLSGVGIYPVGSFVQFSDGADSRLGIVRSVSINAVFPTVRQTIEIECHG